MEKVIKTSDYMSLKEIKNEIEKYMNQLQHWCEKKKINFEFTQPKGTKYKDIQVQSSIKDFDPFATYMIKDEECDETIYQYQAKISSLRVLLAKEILRMKKYEDMGLIVYYKEEMGYSWVKIDQLLHYADGSSKKKYQRYKKGQKQ